MKLCKLLRKCTSIKLECDIELTNALPSTLLFSFTIRWYIYIHIDLCVVKIKIVIKIENRRT